MLAVSAKIQEILSQAIAFALSQLFQHDITMGWIIEKCDAWANTQGFTYAVAWHMQGPLALATGGYICEICNWAITPGNPHESCDALIRAMGLSDAEILQEYENLSVATSGAYNKKFEEAKKLWEEALLNVMNSRGIGETFDPQWPPEPIEA